MPKKAVVRAYLARVEDVNARDRSIVAKINTAAVDRYRTVIDPRGIDLSNYRNNPVVLWEHGRDPARGAMPVGRNEWIKPAIGPDGPELLAKTFFHQKGKKGDDFTDRLFECYRDGDMRAVSVNVVPDERSCSPPTADETRERPELQDCQMMYRKGDLAEYSMVAVGGNAEALTLDEARSVLKLVNRGLALPADLVSRAEEMTDDDDERRIEKEGDKYCVYKGKKKLDEFDTKEEAEACKKGFPKKDKGGKGGKDDEAEDDEAEKKLRSLPALGGRSLADRQAELGRQIRSMFDVTRLTEDLKAQADLKRGKV